MSNSPIEKSSFLMIFAGLGCFILSFVAMGLAPWTTLNKTIAAQTESSNPYIDESGQITSVGRGRKLYIKEACWHCHSQFVRPVAGEPFRYGPPSQAWESRFDVPQLYGTRRVGPDLSRESGRHSDDWHLAHLYNPRTTTPLSVMPSYPWYFEKTENGVKPKQEAQDLVAYLQYLGNYYKDQIQTLAYPRLFKVSGSPMQSPVYLERGALLFTENCVGCHGENGNGEGHAKDFLTPKAANLVDRLVSPSEVYSILNRGVLGSAMPSFKEMPERDLWALAQYVSSLGEDTRQKVLAEKSKFASSSIRRGENIFKTSCVACHGQNGGGDGAAAVALNPRPKDFSRRIFEEAYFKSIVKGGVTGTAMTGFSNLSEEDATNLYQFVTTLYNQEL